jgi:hypothetical protein
MNLWSSFYNIPEWIVAENSLILWKMDLFLRLATLTEGKLQE